MKHIAIYYIATDKYKEAFNYFKQDLKYFYPNFRKTIIILSDGLEEWDNVIENNITYKVYHIDHFTWPIIALFKMKYIYDHRIDCDYVCYFNADLQYNKDYFDPELSILDLNKLNVTEHSYAYYYNRKYDNDLFYDMKIDEIYKKFLSENSVSWIDDKYKYIQACFFFGPSDIVYEMCNDINDMINTDLKINVIPKYHDESYLNKWVLLNNEKVAKPKRLVSNYKICYKNIPFKLVNVLNKSFK